MDPPAGVEEERCRVCIANKAARFLAEGARSVDREAVCGGHGQEGFFTLLRSLQRQEHCL